MKSIALNASVRTRVRRSGNKQLRAAGRIPAVIYGRQTKPLNLEVDAKELGDMLHHSATENVLVDLAVTGDAQSKRLALVQDVQHHPVTGKALHVDFHEVAENEKVTISVPVETAGEAVGVKISGGVIEHVLFKLKVRALPKDLPEQIVLDVSGLELERSIHIGDIKPPEGVEVLGNKESVVVSCAAPRTEAEEAPVAEGAAVAAGTGEVEMLKEKKEGGAAASGAAAAKPGEKAAAPAPEKKK